MSEMHDVNLIGAGDVSPPAAAKAVVEHIVADAPPEYESVMASVPVLPGWVRLLVLIAAPAALWAAIVFASKMLFR